MSWWTDGSAFDDWHRSHVYRNEAARGLQALRTEAVAHAVEACERHMSELFARFGEHARAFCVEDANLHLDFLVSALEVGEPRFFIEYVVWLKQVLESRQIPVESLPVSLEALQEFFDERMGDSGAEIVKLLTDARSALQTGNPPPPAWNRPCPDSVAELEPFLEATISGDRRQATRIFQEVLRRTDSFPETAVHLLHPALYEVGHRWQRNTVSVAQEHLVSAFTQNLLSVGYALHEPRRAARGSALFACVAGNPHMLGVQMVADAFEAAGWYVHFLGADVPVQEVVGHVRLMRPDLLGLSAASPVNLPALQATVAAVRDAFGDAAPRIAAGGLVLNQFPELAARLGVEMLGTDAVAAVEAAR